MIGRIVIVAALLFLAMGYATAKEAVPVAEDPVIEARLMKLAAELRCLVCQNQTLADSHAELAADFRREMRKMMKQGMSNKQIVDFLVQRYGDFIRYRPPMKSTTFLLWFGPLILVVAGSGILYTNLARRRRNIVNAPLTEEEHKRVESLLGGEDNGEHRE